MLFENRWIQFFLGCGIISVAYSASPRTTVEVCIAIGGILFGSLILLMSWIGDKQQSITSGRSARQ